MADSELDLLTLEQMTELLQVTAKNILPEDDYTKLSDNWKRLRVTAGAVTDANALVQSAFRDLWPDTAREEPLERHGGLRSLPRKGAVKAAGDSAGLVSGVSGASWSTTDVLTHPSGQTYVPDSSGTLDGTGQALISITATAGGIAGNLDAGEVLSWESTPTDLEDEVELQSPLVNGAEKEEVGKYRNRVLNRIGQPQMGGNDNDYEQWILESSDDIATAYVWPNRNGAGSVDIAALKGGSGSSRFLTTIEETALAAYVDDLRPVSTGPVRVLTVTADSQNVHVILTPESAPQYARDFDDSTSLTVASWDAATRLLTFTADRPASMAVGHRITVEDSSGEQLEIESLSGTDAVVLVDAKGITISLFDIVYSGGPLVDSVRGAIIDLFDSLGPRGTDFGTGNWVSTLYSSRLFETIQTQEGVLDSIISSPSSNVEPTKTEYPIDDDEVNLLVPGNIVVRYL